ncbi:hypothetical protein ANCDUO_24375 [Ancylostoma duodenale]|uniref:Uncharacterized protein n=1 Tax=Ancylostoma duodenale TaxID=51022 RepID=A0A0C2FFY7_9BILA|nr:hypothetical protein ANCDUO_24375 [Ancylostoma duodenale]
MVPGLTQLTQVRAGIRSSILRQQSKIRDTAAYAKLNKIRTRVGQQPSATELHGTLSARQEDHQPDGQTSLRISSRIDALRVPRTDTIHWTTLARERDK